MLNLYKLPTLLRSNFQTAGKLGDSGQVPDAWKVASFDIDLGTYGVVSSHLPYPILLEKEGLIHLLTESEHVARVK